MKDSTIIQDNDPQVYLRADAIKELIACRNHYKNLASKTKHYGTDAEFAKTIVKYDELILKLKGLI